MCICVCIYIYKYLYIFVYYICMYITPLNMNDYYLHILITLECFI